ncbi:hypothetical protein [Amycolatopsis kentuckyensis]|uniref:hypothetical protein n=1 Tax=Amycolatopsis kentuckyensis TaxID=218823 RepID=UPI000A39C67E|nr:hypothetical protein [Amycolatopsis kentuckyensis]
MTGQHFVDRKPKSEPCPRCGRLQLIGIDEGCPYRVCPTPLTPEAELAALMQGRRSYSISGDFLHYRDSFRMRGDARGRPTVIATHLCHAPIRPQDFDPRETATREVVRILALASRAIESEPVMSVAENNALFAVAEGLNGLVIRQDPAPF